ncbi:MAG: porin family protein [Deltaproteobacteria bacterium]|nr:porin family protein [Deltaproteobacteria bacterium]
MRPRGYRDPRFLESGRTTARCSSAESGLFCGGAWRARVSLARFGQSSRAVAFSLVGGSNLTAQFPLGGFDYRAAELARERNPCTPPAAMAQGRPDSAELDRTTAPWHPPCTPMRGMRAGVKIAWAVGLTALALASEEARGGGTRADEGAVGGKTYGGIQYEDEAGAEEKARQEGAREAREREPVAGREMAPLEERRRPTFAEQVGFGASLGGGVTDFSDDEMGDLTDPGGAYEARVIAGTRLPVGLEVAYVGSAQDIEALGLDEDAVLVSNGIEANARFHIVNAWHGPHLVQPYVLGGIGWSRFDVTNEDFNTSSVGEDDDIFAVPVGAGISLYNLGVDGLILDTRFSYRFAFDEDLVTPTPGVDEPGLDTWSWTARVGYEF